MIRGSSSSHTCTCIWWCTYYALQCIRCQKVHASSTIPILLITCRLSAGWRCYLNRSQINAKLASPAIYDLQQIIDASSVIAFKLIYPGTVFLPWPWSLQSRLKRVTWLSQLTDTHYFIYFSIFIFSLSFANIMLKYAPALHMGRSESKLKTLSSVNMCKGRCRCIYDTYSLNEWYKFRFITFFGSFLLPPRWR